MKYIGTAFLFGSYTAFMMGGMHALEGFVVFCTMATAIGFLTAGIVSALSGIL